MLIAFPAVLDPFSSCEGAGAATLREMYDCILVLLLTFYAKVVHTICLNIKMEYGRMTVDQH